MLLGCLLAACVVSRVNAYAGPEVRPELIHQVGPVDNKLWGDLEFQEASGEVRNALRFSGFNVAPDVNAPPQVLVLTEYGVGEPRTQSSTHTEEVKDWVKRDVVVGMQPKLGASTIRPQYEAVTQPQTSYETVGTKTVTTTTTTYVRHITFAAYDFQAMKERNEMRQLWKVTVVSEGESDDIRSILPAMIAAARPYFGKSTGGQVEQTIKFNSPEVVAVRTGQPPPEPKRK